MAHPPLGARSAPLWTLGGLLDRLPDRALPRALAREALEERERWFLWLPVLFGLGIWVYFGLSVEPPLALLWLLLAGAALMSLASRFVSVPLALALVPAALAAGFGAAQLRTHAVAAPVLERAGVYQIEGRVVLVEDLERGVRLTVEAPIVADVPPDQVPALIRFSVRSGDLEIVPGDRLRARVRLMPPSPPAAPGDFDFARHAFFQGLGAVGYAYGGAEVVSSDRTGMWLQGLRRTITRAITDAVPGAPGAVGAALLTGLRGGIPDAVWRHMQASGLAHLLAISGLHLGLVAGTFFFAARVGIALVPPLALRVNGKKVAAVIALAGAFGYLMITGQTVPTQRAFITTALVLLAVMVDRNPFSMRLVALAALAVLALRPEALLGPSFQMSFAAVIGLIAVYESGAGPGSGRLDGLDRRLLLYVLGVTLTTLVASAVTAPFVVHHFGRLPTYGTLANLIAVPLTAFWIMPLGLLGLLTLPLGLAGPFFAWMGAGIEVLLALAAGAADLPGASVHLPRPPPAAVAVAAFGGLWLCLWRRPWRWYGLSGAVLGLGMWLADDPPDLLVDARGQLIGVRLEDGRLALAPFERDGWVQGGWLERFGQEEPAAWPAPGEASAGGALRCDHEGCVLGRSGFRIALTRRPEALEEDCALADLVISYPRIERCPDGGRLIGPDALRAAQGLALWIEDGAIRTRSVRESRGKRPWTR